MTDPLQAPDLIELGFNARSIAECYNIAQQEAEAAQKALNGTDWRQFEAISRFRARRDMANYIARVIRYGHKKADEMGFVERLSGQR
jgi:hypothetical protein